MKDNRIFITGTDTGVGKTVITGLLGNYIESRGYKVITQKWVQTGAAQGDEDIDTHSRFIRNVRENRSSLMRSIRPFSFAYPASPHLAARLENSEIDTGKIKAATETLSGDADIVLVEGAGGFMVPLTDDILISDIVREMDMGVLLVSENRLGAINQTLTAIEVIRGTGVRLLGVVLNRMSGDEDETVFKDNMNAIRTFSEAAIWGELGFCRDDVGMIDGFKTIGDDNVPSLLSYMRIKHKGGNE